MIHLKYIRQVLHIQECSLRLCRGKQAMNKVFIEILEQEINHGLVSGLIGILMLMVQKRNLTLKRMIKIQVRQT